MNILTSMVNRGLIIERQGWYYNGCLYRMAGTDPNPFASRGRGKTKVSNV
jgi:hypothetical protein